jgi:hypothetical protein
MSGPSEFYVVIYLFNDVVLRRVVGHLIKDEFENDTKKTAVTYFKVFLPECGRQSCHPRRLGTGRNVIFRQ